MHWYDRHELSQVVAAVELVVALKEAYVISKLVCIKKTVSTLTCSHNSAIYRLGRQYRRSTWYPVWALVKQIIRDVRMYGCVV